VPELDLRQQAAVDAGPVDVFIAAGAGSGKTRVLSSRFVSAVLGEAPYERCAPGELLAVTFTEKAAGQLSERIRAGLSTAGESASARAMGDAWISTIHGMCARILRQHAFDAGVDPHFRVLDQIEAAALEAEVIEGSVREVLGSCAGAAVLFDDYGYDTVVSAARRIRASVDALGAQIDDVTRASVRDTARRLHVIADELTALAGEIGALGSMKTIEANSVLVRGAAAALAHALSLDTLDADGLLASLPIRGFRHLSSVEGLDEMVDKAAALVDEARLCAAQMAVEAHEEAFVAFLRLLEARYAAAKAARGALDFEDLQVVTARLLETNAAVAGEYRSRFKMLMLDEFQDTNALQLRIIESLSSGNLCTVGDENQSIYAFRHADVEVFRERAKRVAERRELDINYRTAPALLATVNRMFSSHALLGAEFMSLQAPAEEAPRPEWPVDEPRFEARFLDWSDAKGIDTQQAEAECVADRVAELIAKGVAPESIAILMRALAGGRGSKIERALTGRGIRAHLASGGAFFDCPEVVEARALLRVIDNVWDDAALTVVLAGRLTGLSADSLVALRQRADALGAERGVRRSETHLWEAVTDTGLDGPEARALAHAVAVISGARRARGLRALSETVLRPLIALDADLVMFASEHGGARRWANMVKLARMAAEYESAVGGDLRGFLEHLERREKHGVGEQEAILDGEADAVRIMSIHASKGLEFPAVIVAGLTGSPDAGSISVTRIDGQPLLGMTLPTRDGSVPTLSSARVKAAVRAAADAEAIRLLYVACTRAEETLTIVARTDPLKEADDSLGGLVRQALGVGAADSWADGDTPKGLASARLRLVAPAIADDETVDSAEPGLLQETPSSGSLEAGENASGAPTAASSPARSHQHAAVPRRLSYTGLATYERCPYRFYLTSIARLPAPPAVQGGEALAFGSAVHAVLEDVRSPGVDLDDLVERAARSAGLQPALIGRVREAVAAYLALPVAEEVFACEQVGREVPIAVPVAGTVLAGAIDVLAWRSDDALIVDYKTGTAPLTPEDAITRYRLQGECYALAAFSAGASAVRVVFAELERGRQTSYDYRSDDRKRIEGSVVSLVETMAREGFPPRAAYDGDLCETCPGLGGMCPVIRSSAGDAA
jgi:ATP-dependent exoDNAse (exonuclease V) beta subunit